MTALRPFYYGEDVLTVDIALRISSGEVKGKISNAIRNKIEANRQIVESIASGHKVVYGINSGFGPLCTTKISAENTRVLQEKILISHSVGVGDNLTPDIVKLMMILKINALAQGYSGVNIETINRIIWMVDHNVIPNVPSQGSVGASGDLAPLAHLFLPLIGLGYVRWEEKSRDMSEVYQHFQMKPLTLGPKEGLALINGTQFMLAYAVTILSVFHRCLSQADVIAAMMLEGLLGSSQPFNSELHALRPYAGSCYVASRISAMLEGSEIMHSHQDCERVQDPYSLRCIPQVHGASRNAWRHLKDVVSIELNSVTDNPVIINESLTISGGNFHGQPLAMPLDYACLAGSELGNISDRRIYLSLEGNITGLPKLLMKDTGLNSGFMILQYTSAALVSENKSMCFPSSADSIPTSLGQEDHVSMGSISGRKALNVMINLEKILAIELLCATQALDFRSPLNSTPLIQDVYELVRSRIPHAEQDRLFSEDIQESIKILQASEIMGIVQNHKKAGNFNLDSELEDIFEVY